MYGDLSVSTVDEMPPGRAEITTRQGNEAQALSEVRSEVAKSRQAYIVYPIIHETSRLDLKAAKAEFERLKNTELKGLRVELIHGQMKGEPKAKIMGRFARGETQVLVATQVIEVGVDVSNATIMVIQNADRFGLATLHQLRGRVGRGDHPSQCWLVADPQTEESKRRIRILCESSDGFKIGEEDLKLRGPGDVLGTLQHGELSLRVADLLKDSDLQAQARADAQELLSQDPSLSLAEHRALRERFLDLYQRQWHAVDLA
jgi:ATP-dependent DNA helicase RecG